MKILPVLSIFSIGFYLFFSPLCANGAALDAATRQCIRCHAGEIKAGIAFHSGGSDHPVGMDYASLAQKNPSLVQASKLNPRLRLENGKIGCLTCHVPYEKTNHRELSKKRGQMPAIPDPMLTIDNSISGLCMACHQK